MLRKPKPAKHNPRTTRVLFYRKHPSGIGQILVKEADVEGVVSFAAGYFRDVTNNMWARWVDGK